MHNYVCFCIVKNCLIFLHVADNSFEKHWVWLSFSLNFLDCGRVFGLIMHMALLPLSVLHSQRMCSFLLFILTKAFTDWRYFVVRENLYGIFFAITPELGKQNTANIMATFFQLREGHMQNEENWSKQKRS